MLRPLRRLLLAGQGGATLQDIVSSWHSCPLPKQQSLFSTAVLVASQGRWGQLEEELQLALQLA